MAGTDSIVTIHMAASLDGFIARRDGQVGWMETSDTFEHGNAMSGADVAAFLATIDCYVMGARTYERALALQPDFPEALNNVGLLLGRGGDLAAAERYFREALSRREAYGEAANNLALAALYRKKGDEIGGAQGEEYRKTGKGCEDDARKEEPDLKRAAKKLGAAGVLRFVEEKAPPEIRPFLQGLNFIQGGKSQGNSRPSIGVKIPLGSKGSSIGVGLPIRIPIGEMR